MTNVNQWRHTSQAPEDDSYPLAPWAEHPPVDGLSRDLLADLLADLRDDVVGWAEINETAGGSEHAAARLMGAQAALKTVQRIVKRAETRASR